MYRIEEDMLGKKKVPKKALFGIQTLRALENFQITGQRPHQEFIKAYAMVKRCAARANLVAGKLPSNIAGSIIQACTDIIDGKYHDHFVVDRLANITSFNMNANEVIANRTLELSAEEKGNYKIVHPNDHINMSQSTNDTFPTAMSIAILMLWRNLKKVIEDLRDSFWKKGEEWIELIKSGRTHLQDAVPTSLGYEFRSYGSALDISLKGLEEALDSVRVVPIGGTASGTGANTPSNYVQDFLRFAREDGYMLRSSRDLPYIQSSRGNMGRFSGALRILALELIRIANDLRLLSSGPTSGLSEIQLPVVQPGSSIMPGKVNPVLAESLNMLAFQIIGNDSAVAYAIQAGQLELNVMMPLMINAVLNSMRMLIKYLPIFKSKCIEGITPSPEQIQANLARNPSLATFLTTLIGYDKASEIAKEAVAKNQSIKAILLEKGLYTEEELAEIFSPDKILPLRKRTQKK